MIDIHCHILPEIDDGAQSRGMSLKMCQMAQQSGVSDIVATPHMLDLYAPDEFMEKTDVRISAMQALLRGQGIAVTLHKGAEVYASKDILYSPDLSPYTLAGSRYLLVEFDFESTDIAYAKEVISIVQSQELIPVIAHPERYAFTQSDYENVNRMSDCGALMQCNLGSLTGELGKRSAKLAREMLAAGAISFLASDAHRVAFRNTDINGMIKAIKDNKKITDSADFELLLQKNPAKLIAGGQVAHPTFAPLKKKIFS